jgi:hypothetical protein
MISTHDIEYFLKRESEEIAAATASIVPSIAQIHTELAKRYAAKACVLVALSSGQAA